jgi:transcriptional regulator with XRE-family HTH domain
VYDRSPKEGMKMDETKRIFSINLNRLIHESGKQQREVAEEMGFKPTTVNTWCKGGSFPTTGKLQIIADYFGIGK